MDAGFEELTPVSEKVAKSIEAMQAETGRVVPSVFRVGEILQIKGSRFQVQTIGRKKMKQKILKPE